MIDKSFFTPGKEFESGLKTFPKIYSLEKEDFIDEIMQNICPFLIAFLLEFGFDDEDSILF